MNITQKVNGNILEMDLEGRVDTVTAPELEKAIKASLEGKDGLVLDFKNVEYISSAGLRVIRMAYKMLFGKGRICIRNANIVCREVFEMTGLADVLVIE